MRTYTADEVDEMIGRALAREREQRKPWVGLTDAEVDDLQSGLSASHSDVRAIEAKLREKNT